MRGFDIVVYNLRSPQTKFIDTYQEMYHYARQTVIGICPIIRIQKPHNLVTLMTEMTQTLTAVDITRRFLGLQATYRAVNEDEIPQVMQGWDNFLKSVHDPFTLCALEGNIWSNSVFLEGFRTRLDELVDLLVVGPPSCPYAVNQLLRQCRKKETQDKVRTYAIYCICAALPSVKSSKEVNNLFQLGIRDTALEAALKHRWTELYSQETGTPITEINCIIQSPGGGCN